ncbi:MAG: phosphatidate cytidylyltransferase [Candidatus Heimdallarchaeota archaeon]|nr:MAG: phosphatidate cytidylyltransferase [Candidatus Heimdallarchaeota archaeon]
MGYITLLPDLPLVWNFILGAIVAMIYIQGIILLMERLVNSGTLSSDLSRKVIHIAAGSFIWIWLFMDTSDKLTYMLNIVVPLLFFLTFLLKGTRGSPDDKDVKTMTRTGDPRELLKGPLYFTIVMMVAGTILYGTYAGMLMMAIVGWGDGIAPYIGKRWGKRKFKTLGREKTIEGSIGVLLFSVVGCLIFYVLLGIIGGIDFGTNSVILANPGDNVDARMIVIVIVILGVVAMVVEALSPSDLDNLLIPASTLITLFIIDILLGNPLTGFLQILPFSV